MILHLRSTISRLRREDGGFGLAEFVVAISLFAVLATLIITTFTTFTTTLTEDRAATTNTNIAAVGMDELTRVIRAATTVPVYNADDLPAFTYANKEKIILHAYIDTGSGVATPIKVQFEVNPTSRDLVETRWTATPVVGHPTYWTFNSSPSSVKVIARKIVPPTAGQPSLFNYQEINASLQPVDMTIPVTGITAANLTKIAVVEVTIKVQSDTTGRADPVTMTNQVGIPNLGVSRLGLS